MRSHLLTAVGIVALVSGVAGVLRAQVAVGPTFEVASIKRNKSGPPRSGSPDPPGWVTLTYATVALLVESAYGLRDAEVIGGPAWIRSDRFDIMATTAGRPTLDQRRLMLQNLLADRFKVNVHHETKELPELALVIARGDKKLGPRLQPASAADAVCQGTPGEPAAVLPGGPMVRPCGMLMGPKGLWIRGETMEAIARTLELSLRVGPVVVNRTGLDGPFNASLEWTDERIAASRDGTTSNVLAPDAGDAPSLFTALQDQLGLKLVATKGPHDVIVIDRAQHPTED